MRAEFGRAARAAQRPFQPRRDPGGLRRCQHPHADAAGLPSRHRQVRYLPDMSDRSLPAASTPPSARQASDGIVRLGSLALLRFARASDGPGFMDVLSRSREHLAPWMPRTARGSEPSFGRRFERMLRPAADSAGRLRLLVCARDDGRIVGVASLGGIADWPSLDCHVGYWLAAGETGKGLMRDAVAALLDHAFAERGLHRIAANVLPNNRRSIGLVQGLGFTREGVLRGLIEIDGVWRDHECWSMLSTDWRGGALDRALAPPGRRPGGRARRTRAG
ncbi:MAG: N-acetyltransferase [Actinobacteria bacterium]|nr:N-acetyltransferase [Actinomycetota bacterium]